MRRGTLEVLEKDLDADVVEELVEVGRGRVVRVHLRFRRLPRFREQHSKFVSRGSELALGW